ncbi:MAG: glyoxylate/hydroxypyruvate reductase A [Rhodobacteraceae bacterium]|nr:glyoxylate/hydroxypyruvate reductase A [Paracoccaceae bacterium]
MTDTLTLLFAAPPADWAEYEAPLTDAFARAGFAARIVTATDRPETIDYIIYAPSGPVSDFTPFTRTRAVLSLWAGVERIVTNPTLTQPLVRMVDPEGLSQGMAEWVTGHVLRHHLGIDRQILHQDGTWDPVVPKLAPDRAVTVLGLGELGAVAAAALARLGFRVSGWSRHPRDLDGVTCHHGPDGLSRALRGAEIVVLLLPLTPATENLIDAGRLALLARDAVILNPGRGGLIDDHALIAALDAGHLAHATLDVFRTEPLPPEHPFWAHPRITVTPHVAAATRPGSAARRIAETVALAEAGHPLPHLVDRTTGY